MGSAHPLDGAGVGRGHLFCHRDAQLLETFGQRLVAGAAVVPEPVEFEAERALGVLHEVDEHVDTTPGHRHAGDLAAGHQPDAQFVGPDLGPGQAGEGVVVGEGHRTAADLVGHLDDPLGSLAPVGPVGVGVQVDHAAHATGRVGRRLGRGGPHVADGRMGGWADGVRVALESIRGQRCSESGRALPVRRPPV